MPSMDLCSIIKSISVLPKDRLYKFKTFAGLIIIGVSIAVGYFSMDAFFGEAKEIIVSNSVHRFDLNGIGQSLLIMEGNANKLMHRTDDLTENTLTCLDSKDIKQLELDANAISDEVDKLETELDEIKMSNSSIARQTVEKEAKFKLAFLIYVMRTLFAFALLIIGNKLFAEGCSAWKKADDSSA